MSLIDKLFGKKELPAPDPEIANAIAALVGCDFERVDPRMDAAEITAYYLEALHRGRKNGFHPLLVVTSDTLLETIEDNCEDNAGVEAYRGRLLTEEADRGGELLSALIAENKQQLQEYSDEENDLLGAFDEQAQPMEIFAGVSAKERSANEELLLFWLPITKPWRCFAYLPVGNWNDCPTASDQMAVCRYWYEAYGAFPAMISSDILQLYVPAPVTLRTNAMQLSEEQYAFCNDIVEQGTGTLGALAGTLMDSHIWYFWWD